MSTELVDRFTLPPAVVNPFVNDLTAHNTPLQYLKMIIIAGTLFPFRILGFVVCILIAFVAGKVALSGLSDEEWLMKPMRQGVAKKIMFVMSRWCMFALGYQWLEADTRNFALRRDGRREEAPMIVVNHSTVTDGFLLFYLHGLMSVGIDALAEAPIFGTFARAGQAFSLNRDDPACKKKIAAEIQRRVTWTEAQASTLGHWPPFTVFAEGTCTNQKALIQFRHGAFLPGVAVQPMIVRYPFRHCDQSWCGLSNPVPVLLRMMLQLHNRLEFSYLPVYEPSEEEKRDPYLFAENVRREMANALGIGTTEHTYEDMRLAAYAQKRHHISWRSIHAEMGRFRALGCSFDVAKLVLDRFALVDRNRDGFIDRNEFKAYFLGASKVTSAMTALSEAIFNALTIRTPVIDFRTFFVVMGLRGERRDNANDANTYTNLYVHSSEEQRLEVHQLLLHTLSGKTTESTCSQGEATHAAISAGLQQACGVTLAVASAVADEWLGGADVLGEPEWHAYMQQYPMLPEFLLFSLKIA